ncbi:MAG: O-antigen ligase family protein [Pontiellaceae bacterium]|nr:O-antigen ligase family protein [Pontiellaceae bacterium]MBN2784041.1 O-antigen ligase family protein [Pontiellaceae bacterium]
MTSVILFFIAVCSFLFYGVVGEDKTWLLAPAYTVILGAVSVWLVRPLIGVRQESRGSCSIPPCGLPLSGMLFIFFVLWGGGLIPQAAVPFESKLTLLLISSVLGAYLVWGTELTSFKDNRLLLGFLVLVVMAVALYGVIIHFKAPEKLLWTNRYTDHYDGRLASTYICPNHFAHLMQMLMPFCVALLFVKESGMFLRLFCGYSFAVFLPPLFLSESRAGWLGSIAGVGVTVCLIALRRSKKLFLILIILVPLSSALMLFGAWRFSETFQRRMAPVVEFLQGQSEGGTGADAEDFRPQTWMDTIDMIKEAPLIGFGPGNYRYTYPEHRNRFRGTRIVTGHPHNEYLELMADYGLIGFGLFALAWCYGLIRILIAALKAEEPRHAFMGFAFLGTACGTMVHSFFDFEMHVFPNAMVFALLAAIASGPLFADRRDQKRNGHKKHNDSLSQDPGGKEMPKNDRKKSSESLCPQWLTRISQWMIAAGYLLLTLMCVQVMGSSFIRALADKRSEALGVGRLAMGDERCVNLYTSAAKVDPQNWRAYKGMAGLLFDQRYYSLDMEEKVLLAVDECGWYAKAHQYNPKDPEICTSFGKALIFLGKSGDGARDSERIAGVPPSSADSSGLESMTSGPSSAEQIDQGLDLLREACVYRPYNDLYWWTLGVELRKLEYYDEALEVFKKARSIRRTPSTNANIKWIESRQKALDSMPHISAVGAGQAESRNQAVEVGEWRVPDPKDAEANPDLMNLLEKMEP